MPRNVEVKAKVADLEAIKLKALKICGKEAEIIEQYDTFFKTDSGRLKLREFKSGEGELIFYDRSNELGPKVSDYCKTVITDPSALKSVLAMALGVRGTVKKTRYLYLYHQTRIHIDDVVGLGSFMELEVVLNDDETLESGATVAKNLLENLGVSETDLVSGSYFDSLSKQLE